MAGRSGHSTRISQMESDLGAIRRRMRKPLDEEVAKGGLTVPQQAIMQVVVRRAGIRLKDLSQQVNLAHSTASGIVDRLEAQGLLVRRADASDKRVSCIYPTAEVTEFVRKKIPALRKGRLSEALKQASADEQNKIAWALRRLRELLEAV